MTYFSDKEWKNKAMCKQKLIDSVENFRIALMMPFTLTSDYAADGHSPNSYHYKGEAIDAIPNSPIPIHLFLKTAALYFNGVGLYIDVATKQIAYFHLDIREGVPQTWIGLVSDKIDYIYKVGK